MGKVSLTIIPEFAVLLIATSFLGNEIGQVPGWGLWAKVLGALSVIMISALIWPRNMRRLNLSLAFLCSLILVALGAVLSSAYKNQAIQSHENPRPRT